MAFGGFRTSLHPSEIFVPQSSLLVWNVSIVNAANSSLLRSLPQPQNLSPYRSGFSCRLPGHVHGGSCLLGHDNCSRPAGLELNGDLDRRLGAIVSSVVHRVAFIRPRSAIDRLPFHVGVTLFRSNPSEASLGSLPWVSLLGT